MVIAFPTNTKEIIDAIRGAIGRDVSFYVEQSSTPCPVCSLDPITNTSTNSFCPTCSGTYWITTYSGVTMSGHITWNNYDQLQWVTGGQYFVGDCRVQVEYTPTNLTVIDNCKWVDVDGKNFTVKSKILRGVPTVNRILVDLVEKEA